MKLANLKPQYIYNKSGEKTFVVLPVKEYEQLLEDLYDLSIIADRREEPRLSFDQFEEGLRKDGLL